MFILEYTVDTENSENLGVYALRIVNKEDEDTNMTYWQDMVIPGIYRPDKWKSDYFFLVKPVHTTHGYDNSSQAMGFFLSEWYDFHLI